MKLWVLPQEFDDYWVCIYVSFSLLICWMVNILYSPVFELYYFVICDFCLLLTINFSLIKEKTNILALCILMWVYYIANCNFRSWPAVLMSMLLTLEINLDRPKGKFGSTCHVVIILNMMVIWPLGQLHHSSTAHHINHCNKVIEMDGWDHSNMVASFLRIVLIGKFHGPQIYVKNTGS